MSDDLKINLQSSFERSPDSVGERRALETGDNLSGADEVNLPNVIPNEQRVDRREQNFGRGDCGRSEGVAATVQNNFPVPVLAEQTALPKPSHRETPKGELVGSEMTHSEAREAPHGRQARGGENTLSVGVQPEQPKDTEGNPANLEQATPINPGAVIDTVSEALESTENCDRMGTAREIGSMADSSGAQNFTNNLGGGLGGPSIETTEAKQDIDKSRPTGVTRSAVVSHAECEAPPAQSSSTERGDQPCRAIDAIAFSGANTEHTNNTVTRSSNAASTFDPKGAATASGIGKARVTEGISEAVTDQAVHAACFPATTENKTKQVQALRPSAACPQDVASPTLTTQEQRQPSMRPSPVSGVTPPVHTRWKKGCPSPNPGGRPKITREETAKWLEEKDDEGKTNARKAIESVGEVAQSAGRHSAAALKTLHDILPDDKKDGESKGGVSIGNLNMAIIQQIQRAATEGALE